MKNYEEYKESCLLSHDEYIILKNINKNWKWIVRDDEQDILLFVEKPYKKDVFWIGLLGSQPLYPFKHMFKFIK